MNELDNDSGDLIQKGDLYNGDLTCTLAVNRGNDLVTCQELHE